MRTIHVYQVTREYVIKFEDEVEHVTSRDLFKAGDASRKDLREFALRLARGGADREYVGPMFRRWVAVGSDFMLLALESKDHEEVTT